MENPKLENKRRKEWLHVSETINASGFVFLRYFKFHYSTSELRDPRIYRDSGLNLIGIGYNFEQWHRVIENKFHQEFAEEPVQLSHLLPTITFF